MGRSIVAVLAGDLLFTLSAIALFRLSGREPSVLPGKEFIFLTIVYGMLFALLGGYLAARLAPGRPRLHAAAVAVLIASGAIVSLLVQMRTSSVWTQLCALIFMAPMALLGGRICRPRT